MAERTAAANRPFTKRQRRSMSRQYGYGYRPVTAWGDGDLPGPWAEGDSVRLSDTSALDPEMMRRLHGMGAGCFVVTNAFSIDEGDAWYMRVSDGEEVSDRLHVAWAARSTWTEDCDYMAGFELIETADPAGLAKRHEMLAAGWQMPLSTLLVERELRAENERLRELLGAVRSHLTYADLNMVDHDSAWDIANAAFLDRITAELGGEADA